MRLRKKKFKDLKIKHKELAIIFNYTVCTGVLIHSMLNVMHKVKI